MRLIDADKFVLWLDVGHLRNPSEPCMSELNVKNAIELQPIVDAVEVVRCENCKFWLGEILGNRCKYHSGLYHIEMTPPDAFCSYGERRNDDA